MVAINWIYFSILVVLCFTASIVGTRIVLHILKKRQILDLPNERSNHKIPTPRGGGIAIIGTVTLAWLVIAFMHNETSMILAIIAPALALAVLSFLDDIRSQPVALRFGLQIAAVAIGVIFLYQHPGYSLLFQGHLPLFLDIAFCSILWLWFINLYNFMDGIDGITSCESIAVAIGIILLTSLLLLTPTTAYYASVLAASLLGFLWWNKHPAKIFMGDIGSIPLGFLFGYLLLSLAMQGLWAAALLLPAYYLADSTYTITKRLLQGKKIWQAHSEHFYQQAVRSGMPHSRTVTYITILNQFLIVLSLTTALKKEYFWHSIVLAMILTALLLWFFGRNHIKNT